MRLASGQSLNIRIAVLESDENPAPMTTMACVIGASLECLISRQGRICHQ
jgi:hypothetical protein